jgi:hypothetical protein
MSHRTFDFSVALEAYQELLPELRQAETPDPAANLPRLDDVLAEAGPLPEDALIFGIAGDGMPLLLNLTDPVPGPILLTGERGAGKTRFLQTLAWSVGLLHPPEAVSFGVLTNTPEEWDPNHLPENCVGIFGLHQRESCDFVLQLAAWIDRPVRDRHIALLLIDDLEPLVNTDGETRRNLQFLLQHGPERGVWPVATLEPQRCAEMTNWAGLFRTHIFGAIDDRTLADQLSGGNGISIARLIAGIQFALRGRMGWLKFWLPTIE